MIGLKENVIIGKLIPAGTGLLRYREMQPYNSETDEATSTTVPKPVEDDLEFDFSKLAAKQ